MKQCIRWLYGIVLVFVAMCATAASATSPRPVIFLHGWNSDGAIWDNMMNLMVKSGNWSRTQLIAPSYLESKWWIVEGWGYGDSDLPISVIADRVYERYVKPELDKRDGSVDFVVHSMGGLVLRQMIVNHVNLTARIGRVVDLATPHYGQAQEAGTSAEEMYYGSPVLWNLLQVWPWKDSCPINWLNIAGIYKNRGTATKAVHDDALVDQWSAGWLDTPVRYVNKGHSEVIPFSGPTIYSCNDGENDIVFRLVRDFLCAGTIMDQSVCGVSAPTDEGGGIFLQVIDSDGLPVSWEGNMVASIVNPSMPNQDVPFVQKYGANGEGRNQGICLLAYKLGSFRGFDPGIYDIEFRTYP